ncbi:aconitate hydratase [Metasolibacillus sp. FSL H7-0170]|uniref:aconitate hydratase n=1 Tax=Metasolibacillus sp. FSL H7-0170 TaxID=2921431 RepID=UPI00315921BD
MSMMIHCNERQLVHKFIILELTMRTLQYDFSLLSTLKMHRFYTHIMEKLVKKLRLEYEKHKQLLKKQGIRFVQLVKVNEYFCDVILATSGEDLTIRYANQTLKKEVERLILLYFE